MKCFKLHIYFLVVLMVVASFSGAYATIKDHNNSEISINKGKVLYVAKNGTDRNDGLTLVKPKRNIENAIDAANPGDIIKVGKGIYPINLQITKNITLIGDNQKNTVIDGQQKANCIQISGAVVTIINFTIKNGIGPHPMFGGGIHNEGTVYLINSTITDCNAEFAGGIYNLGKMTLKKVTIQNNKANMGGGIYNHGTMIIEDSTITNNTAIKDNGATNGKTAIKGVGGGIDNRNSMILKRVDIQNNKADDCAGIWNGAKMTIKDSTIKYNEAKNDCGGIGNGSLLFIYGSIITNNTAKTGGGVSNGHAELMKVYMDDFTIIKDNTPTNFGGNPFIPA